MTVVNGSYPFLFKKSAYLWIFITVTSFFDSLSATRGFSRVALLSFIPYFIKVPYSTTF